MLTLQITNKGNVGVMRCPIGDLCSLSALAEHDEFEFEFEFCDD